MTVAAFAVLTPTQKLHVRDYLAQFFRAAESHRLSWAYSQRRPYTGLGVAPEHDHIDDCSAYAALGFYWAMHKTSIMLPDPLNVHYSGYGNTSTSIAFVKAHRAPQDKYLVGDLAFFGTNPYYPEHMSICREAGTAKTSIFSSNGHQSWVFVRDAPEPISLADESVKQHLIGVYRHPSLL